MSEPRRFDVIVVGAGAAGCVVAARLAHDPARSVLLLEAGPDLRAAPPARMRDGWGFVPDEFEWGYTSEPDEQGGTLPVRRNKVIGGTSWMTRFTPRGSPADYDAWAAAGNTGWSWTDVLPWFIRLEHDLDFGGDPWHGDRGPMPSNRYLNLEYSPALDAAVQVLDKLGFPPVEDHNKPGAVGVGRMPMSSVDGQRVTAADAYLGSGSTGPNVFVRAEAYVDSVELVGTRATGVRLTDGSFVEGGWIVLCGGVYGSPAVLMRSGIGPAEHLRSVGVPSRIDLAGVGANLTDHPEVEIDLTFTGPVRGPEILHTMTTFHSTSQPRNQPPDLMFWIADPSGDPPVFAVEVLLLKPRSRGTVRLRSGNPEDAPLIFLPRLDEASDVARLAEGLTRAYELASRQEIQQLCGGIQPESLPPSGADLEHWVRANRYSIPHVVGTCAMGARPEDGAVVDSSGRVHGTERLSVVDASIMPDVPSGFTHFPTIMIAEKLSEKIAALI